MDKRARWIAVALVALAVAAGAAGWWLYRRGPAGPPQGASGGDGFVSFRERSLRYDYHIVSGTESLCDTAADPGCARNVLAERRADAKRLRQALERTLGLSSLDDLRHADREKIERLKSLGYL